MLDAVFLLRATAFVCLVGLLTYTLSLIRGDKLTARLAISWIFMVMVLLVLVTLDEPARLLASFVGEENVYPVTLLLLVAWIILLMLDVLTRLSDASRKVQAALQENAILRERVDRIEQAETNSKTSKRSRRSNRIPR